jgi:hypothetical protein
MVRFGKGDEMKAEYLQYASTKEQKTPEGKFLTELTVTAVELEDRPPATPATALEVPPAPAPKGRNRQTRRQALVQQIRMTNRQKK